MSTIQLTDLATGVSREFDSTEVKVGRDPHHALCVSGPEGKVVSSTHARFVVQEGQWCVEDLGSRNGTYVDGTRLEIKAPKPLSVGQVVRFGETGPQFRVTEASARQVPVTVVESAIDLSAEKTLPMEAVQTPPRADSAAPKAGPDKPEPAVVFEEKKSGQTFKASGVRIRIGRGTECELRPVSAGDTSVSRVHSELTLKPDGKFVIRDARSRNGTLVNGRPLTGEHSLRMGDSITLGEGGPELLLTSLTLPERVPPPPAEPGTPAAVPLPTSPRRSFGGRGATQFMKELVAETSKKSATRTGKIVWTFLILLLGSVAALYWYNETRVQETVAALEVQRQELLAQRVASDSLGQLAAAEMGRLRAQLEEASASAAPAAMLDSIRAELQAATQRTQDLEAALQRAQSSMTEQLAAGAVVRREAQADLAELRQQLQEANANRVSIAQLDSLRQAVIDAEQQVSGIESRIRAVQGVDLAAVAQANQGAVGLVTAYSGRNFFNGSGFMISPAGYFVTNRHVVFPEGRRADSVFIAMADQRFMRRARFVIVAPADGPDLAVVRLRNYSGPYMERIDWSGTRAAQGEPAALIGFPAGTSTALDQSQIVRTSMAAGIFSKVTADDVQFDGFTVGGSSGSPVFNANGEVIAVHHSGLSEGAGLGFAVPMALLVPLLPDYVKSLLRLR